MKKIEEPNTNGEWTGLLNNKFKEFKKPLSIKKRKTWSKRSKRELKAKEKARPIYLSTYKNYDN